MNKETVEKRKELRMHLLTNLYEHYFKNKGKGRYLRLEVENIVADSEVELAYTYLLDKGFIKNQGSNNISALIITTEGIDLAESHFAK
ncbi:hypothetical protein [Lysinibacillus sphaericus]|uniref:hypothetical protein n=1 Tax=Lysinibacillus sphaericus TaxID=1421 RepID=UPI003CFC9EFA